jgi:hypothetical protein
MDIYHKTSLITTGSYAATLTTKVKGVLFVNTNGSPSNVDLFPWGATGATFSMRMVAGASSSTIFPIKTSGASCATGVSVYGLY